MNSIAQPIALSRNDVLPEAELPDSTEIIDQGRKQAKQWRVGSSAFLIANNCQSEAEYKRIAMAQGRVMQHAHMGFRDSRKSQRAFAEIYEATIRKGVTVDRFGICLDWSMGFPRNLRDQQMRGTGLILNEPEEFVAVTNAAPVASHFGDFVLGFPAALENTKFALAAGSTSIGNLGQYFTFRLPDWNDDIATTSSTLTAIALMAAQPQDILIHSNLDDGFAAVFKDISSALGAAMIERYLIEDLMGGKVTHCFGHHYTTPLLRFAFQQALTQISSSPGSMIYGNTVSYLGDEAENFASLSGYLMIDIAAQLKTPSGHAINPVPVTENKRIPDIDEIINAQLFAGRLIPVVSKLHSLVDPDELGKMISILIQGGTRFKDNLLKGFAQSGIDVTDPFEMFLAIRRIGGKTLERLYGPGSWDDARHKRQALVLSDTDREIEHRVQQNMSALKDHGIEALQGNDIKVVTATTDVHEHGKMLIEAIFEQLDITVVDGGISVDPDTLANIAEQTAANAIALSTYNGIALNYFSRLQDELKERGLNIPVFIGGQLNQIPEESDASLPLDVSEELRELGAVVCYSIHDTIPCLLEINNHIRSGYKL